MSDPAVTAFTSLEPGQTIGPSHRRFTLISAGPSHPPGQLWRAQDLAAAEPTEVSLLIFDPRQFSDSASLERIQATLNRTKVLKSPYLMPFYGQYFFRGMLFIALPLVRGVNLAQLIESDKLSKLSERQRIGMMIQLGRALHAVQMGRMNHGTLCPELIWLIPGRGVQLLGTGWYNALDSDTAELSYANYQPEDHLVRGIASNSGDAFALARLITQIFNRGKLDISHRPSMLDDNQWHKLSELLTNRVEAEIQAPLQLVRELFSEQMEQTSEVDTDALDVTSQDEPKPAPEPEPQQPTAADRSESNTKPASAPLAGVETGSEKPGAATESKPHLTSVFRFDITRIFSRPLWLITGFLAGIMVSQLFNLVLQEEPPIEAPGVAAEPTKKRNTVDAIVTVATADSEAMNPFKPENLNLMAHNHLAIFQHPTPPGVTAPKMVSLPTGRFLMGDIQGVGDDNEKPVHQVIVERRFALSRFEITFAEYDQFAQATGRERPDDGGWGRGQRPVINVSWLDAQAYAAWLAQQTGQAYRLPSEAEWEYAARAGTESAYWWGDSPQAGMAQCDDCNTDVANQTAEVGQFPPNPWGLFDLNGNVDEWVADCYSENYMGAANSQTARTSGSCDQRVMRGGSWFDIARLVRSSARYRHPADARRDSWGFRVAVDLN